MRCLGLIDTNAASVSAISAAHLHALRAGVSPPSKPSTAEGIGIYPLLSFANHSCAPNALNAKGASADDGEAALDNTLVLRALRPIAKGEELSFDYLDLAHAQRSGGTAVSADERRRPLRRNFGFECACREVCARRGTPS